MEISLGGWRFRTNPAENARGNVPYLCACQSCRNFLAAVETLPGETHAFFRRLGLDIRCPTEALVSGPLGPDGCCDYRVWYDFPGELTRTPVDRAPYPAAPGLWETFRWMRSFTCPSYWMSRGRIEWRRPNANNRKGN